MNKARLLTIVCLISMSTGAKAQSMRETKMDSLLQEVVVTATRTSTTTFLLPFSIEKINAVSNSFRMPRTTPEALMQTSGVFVQKTNHGGGSAFLRGLTGNQTLLLLDGIRLNNATFRYGPNQYLNAIDAYAVAAIEVLKGSGSVQYGSDAMGGTIQLFGFNPEFSEKRKWFGTASAKMIGRGMEQSANLRTGYATKNWTFHVGITDRNFGDLYGGDTTRRQSPSGYKERDWELKAQVKLSSSLSLKISSQKLTQTNVPLYHKVKLENYNYYNFNPQSLQISYAELDWNYGKKWMEHLQLKLFQKKSKEGRSFLKNNSALWFEEFDQVNTTGFTLNSKASFSSIWTANSGIELYNDKVNSLRKKADLLSSISGAYIRERGLYPDNAIQRNFSLYTLHHVNYKKWTFEPGIRYNYIANLLPSEITSLDPNASKTTIRQHPSSFVGNMSSLYQLTASQVLYAAFSSGYRAPNIDDMGTLGLVDFRYEVPAYDLQPEKSYTTEIGYRFHHSKVNFQVAAYYMHVKDLISRVRKGMDSIQSYPVYIKTNDQVGFIKGIESSYEIILANRLRLKGFFSTQYGQNLTRNEPMRRIPPANGCNTLLYRNSNWNFSLEHQWAKAQTRLAQGDKDDNRIPKGGTPGWQVWNLYLGYQTHSFSIQSSINNIANVDYRLHGSGINGMGRALVLSVRYDW